MAAPLVSSAAMSLNKLAAGFNLRILTATSPFFQQSCGKKTKSNTKSKNKVGHARPKYRKPLKHDGAFVYKGEILLRQYGLTFYPGENVGILRNNTLIALRDGSVIVTCEKLRPYPDSPLYERVHNGLTIYKKFWNIYPTPLHAKFKLISET